MRKLVVLLCLLTALALAAPVQASAPPTIIDDPVAGDTFVNPCTGEIVTLAGGVFQIVFHETIEGSDGFHAILEGNAQGVTGVSDTGTLYRAVGGFWAEFSTGPGRAETFTITDVFMLVSRGDGDNFAFIAAFHVTVDANGALTAFVDVEADGPCRG
jgi:hypothetical protein